VYAVQLAAPPDGPVTDIRCTSTGGADDNIVDLATGKATVTVQAGESIRCVFVDGWAEDDLETATQSQWGDETSNAASILAASFSSVFGRLLQIGGERVAVFSSASAIITYLPALGTSGPLSEDVLNPVVTNSGEMGGEVLALRLNIDFSRASILGSTTRLGELRFCDVTSLPLLNGQTVDLFSTTVNQLLGGETAPIGSSTATAVLRLVNAAFAEGTPSSFAQLVLFDGDCP
jgi:hypothetical protein